MLTQRPETCTKGHIAESHCIYLCWKTEKTGTQSRHVAGVLKKGGGALQSATSVQRICYPAALHNVPKTEQCTQHAVIACRVLPGLAGILVNILHRPTSPVNEPLSLQPSFCSLSVSQHTKSPLSCSAGHPALYTSLPSRSSPPAQRSH